jgi:hypothetical protein
MTALRTRLISRVAKFGVEERKLPGRNDGFACLCFGGKAFAHFHHDNELDIRLTKAVIVREKLTHPPDSTIHPNRAKSSQWIELRFHCAAEVERVAELVKSAIDAL